MPKTCVIVGTGPAALMAADLLSAQGIIPLMFERRSAAAWKLLVAGSSGLNITYDCPREKLADFYFSRRDELRACFKDFAQDEWIKHLSGLGEEPYLGSSHRYFVKNKTAARLQQSWLERLKQRGVEINYEAELTDLKREAKGIRLSFSNGKNYFADAALLAVGGASWEKEEPSWPKLLRNLGLDVKLFAPSNVGYTIQAPEAFFKESAGQAIKGLILQTERGTRQGELMITDYGLEGTPVYTVGCPGPATLDLKPEIIEAALATRLQGATGSIWKRIERVGKLSPGALLLLKHLAPTNAWDDATTASHFIKHFPLTLLEPRPLAEAISSSGGISWDELDSGLQSKKVSGLFFAGEMIDWDAPTGGFLLQGCVSTAAIAATTIANLDN